MPTSKAKISEQVSRLYARFIDRENTKPIANPREVTPLVEQSLNAITKGSIQESGKYGGLEVSSNSRLLFESEPVQTDSKGAYIDLPIVPMDLRNDMGVWLVSDSDNPLDFYIPLPHHMFSLLKGTVLEKLEQNIGWFKTGKRIRFTKDITQVSNGEVTNVDLELVVHDLSEFTDNEPLPISPEHERAVILATLETLGSGIISQNELKALIYKKESEG